MVNYKLTDWGSFFYNGSHNEILIGLTKDVYNRLLKADKLNEFISDCLVHEHIHKWIDNTMGNTICSLFDAIGHHFEDYDLFKRMFHKTPDSTTWKQYIELKGFDAFAKYYNLSHYDLVEAGVRKE